jgi:hypothetical protein
LVTASKMTFILLISAIVCSSVMLVFLTISALLYRWVVSDSKIVMRRVTASASGWLQRPGRVYQVPSHCCTFSMLVYKHNPRHDNIQAQLISGFQWDYSNAALNIYTTG